MSLDKFKQMESQITELTGKLEDMATRKTKVVTAPSDKMDAKISKRASDLYLFSQITDTPLENLKGYSDVGEQLSTRAMVPADNAVLFKEEFSNDLFERITLMANVEKLFPNYKIPKNVKSLSVPEKLTKSKAYIIQPAAAAIESAITAAKVTFVASRLMTFVSVSDQADDEAVWALLDVVKQDIAESLVIAMEDAIINGDTTAGAGNINGATVGGDATDYLRVFDGIRKITTDRANTIDFGGALTYNKLMSLRASMGKDGVTQNDLVYLVSPSAYHQLVILPEVQTVDKYGMAATVVTGEVAKIGAIPVMVSEFIPETLDAAGVESDTDTNTVVVLVNRKYFGVADRGIAGLEQDRDIRTTTDLFVGHRDVDFKSLLSAKEVSAIGYNIPA